MFAKYTVSEVKFVQHQLRADADAKQEELRLMVGERYRDLLQASTSIISMARSSKRLLEALDETKSAISDQKVPPLPRKSIANGAQDTHLHTLQLLSAHIKLLLDAPEHLWRLIERKKYFAAAWLYLLSDVVYRALRHEEETWADQGIHLREQFPLIGRQWEAVSQFRSQIVHKATLALREPAASSTDVCATALTLHLLDSRPLTETLTVFLTQRSRSLSVLLSYGLGKSPMSPSLGRAANGHPPEQGDSKPTARQIKDITQAALDNIASTVKTSRDVFENSSSSSSIAESVLGYIQSDSTLQSSAYASLPTELQLTTESLLMTLPSSTHFMLLPAHLKFYKPAVDVNSPKSRVSPADLRREVITWLEKATTTLKVSLDRWFVDLSTVKNVWTTRHSLRKWILSFNAFQEQETKGLSDIIDAACRKRISTIWRLVLSQAETSFRESILQAVSSFSGHQTDALPMQNLFQNPPLTTMASTGPADASFQKYKSSLRKQLLGRTALLDEVLRTLESCARALQNDMTQVLSTEDGDTTRLVHDLKAEYQPDAMVLCSRVVQQLDNVSSSISEQSEAEVESLVFVGKIANELASTSSFVSNLCVENSTIEDLREKAAALRETIVERWRIYTVSNIVSTNYSSSSTNIPTASTSLTLSWNLTNSLLELTYAVQKLGIARESSRQTHMVDKTLQLFINTLFDKAAFSESVQGVFEITFLEKISLDRENVGWNAVRARLEQLKADTKLKLPPATTVPDEESVEHGASEYLARTQLLFGALLSPRLHVNTQEKLGGLLPCGIPSVDQREFQPVMEVAKSADGSLPQRFNEILVA
ncbi:hypothetical protein BDZ89DRAFT_981120 [Hymenopellis radicata]|nr:hypothetical protein BDZ89DRAFT_981120 [Hymenopellis radicata]